MFRPAGQAEILRSKEKDEFYMSKLRYSLSDNFQNIFGMRRWISFRKELEVLADFGYFLLTTAAGFQTLGEEYVNIVPVDGTFRKPVSTLRRLLMVVLHIGTPYLFEKFLTKCQKDLLNPGSKLSHLSPNVKQFLLQAIPVVKQCVLFCHRLHLTAFYLRGFFYHIAKRLMGVHYVQVSMKPTPQPRVFRFLGWLTALQLVGGVLLSASQFQNILKDLQDKMVSALTAGQDKSRSTTGNVLSHHCPLCLETYLDTTATPCGHLFCWSCILEWCQTKAECPLCRQELQSCRLIFLQNYDF
ncbi:peroxisome biogenesis factor 10-like [Argonauta hians]